jgi:hypothetical protein
MGTEAIAVINKEPAFPPRPGIVNETIQLNKAADAYDRVQNGEAEGQEAKDLLSVGKGRTALVKEMIAARRVAASLIAREARIIEHAPAAKSASAAVIAE